MFRSYCKIKLKIDGYQGVGIVALNQELEDYDLKDFLQVLNVNPVGAFTISKAVVPIMKKITTVEFCYFLNCWKRRKSWNDWIFFLQVRSNWIGR